jgi:hypothetical protein
MFLFGAGLLIKLCGANAVPLQVFIPTSNLRIEVSPSSIGWGLMDFECSHLPLIIRVLTLPQVMNLRLAI